jgi:hypothetical protein
MASKISRWFFTELKKHFMAKSLIPPRTIFGILILIGFAIAVRVFVAPPDTFIYGSDGKWLQDPGNPAKALAIREVGRTATWSDGKWIDNKNLPVQLGPPPPPGWKQNESALEEVSGPGGRKAVWYAKNHEWLDDSGQLIWQVPTH